MVTINWPQRQAVDICGAAPQHNNHQQDDLPLTVLGRVSGSQNRHRRPVVLVEVDSSPAQASCMSNATYDSDQEVVVFDNSPGASGGIAHREEALGPTRNGHHDAAQLPRDFKQCTTSHSSAHCPATMLCHHQAQPNEARSVQTPPDTAGCNVQRQSQSLAVTPIKETAFGCQGLSPLNPQWQHSPAFSCASMPSPQQLYAVISAANSTSSFSTQSMGSCNGLGLPHVVKKYKRAKALLQAHLHEVQRLKGVAAAEAQKAAVAAEQAATLEAQLATSTSAVIEARVAQQELQQQVRIPCVLHTIDGPMLLQDNGAQPRLWLRTIY